MYNYANPFSHLVSMNEAMELSGSPVISCAVAGASGYSGCELLRLLSAHRNVRVHHAFAAGSAGRHVAEIAPSLAGAVDLKFETF